LPRPSPCAPRSALRPPCHAGTGGSAASRAHCLTSTSSRRWSARRRSSGGHRGFTHSLVFAALLGAAFTTLTVRHDAAGQPDQAYRRRLWLAFALATASHAGLDSLTTYGDGVALLAPFDWALLTAPWHPLGSPDAARGRGPVIRSLLLFANEAVWVWIPALTSVGAAALIRRRARLRPGVPPA
jgi:inner membrane protein